MFLTLGRRPPAKIGRPIVIEAHDAKDGPCHTTPIPAASSECALIDES